MRVRIALQMLVIVFAVGVTFTVYWNWRPAAPVADPATASEPAPADDAPVDDREVVSRTENIYIVESKNGRDVFAIWAEEQVDYDDDWNTWSNVRVLILGNDGDEDDIEIRSDRARTAGSGGSAFDEVQFVGSVVATLPSGGRFTTRRIDYDAVTGEVSNCNRNILHYGGLEVRADCMEFQTAGDVSSASAVAEELRMWQNLSIHTGATADPAAMPSGLAGKAQEMRFRPGGEFVRLSGQPQVTLDGVAIRGDEVVLDVGPDADELRGLVASGAARVRLGGPAEGDSGPDAGAEVAEAPESTAVGQTLTGEEIRVVLAAEGGGVEGVTATAGTGNGARLVLDGFGRLDAGELEVTPGDRLTARARRDVIWTPKRGSGPISDLTAEDLRLNVLAGELESLEAGGGVMATLPTVDGSERNFEGERLILGWVNGVMLRGVWPEGLALNIDGRTLQAAHAALDPDDGAWVLSGDTAPRVAAAEFDFSAQQIRLNLDGSLEALGAVTGTIGGSYLAAAAALFGDAEAVQLRAGRASVDRDGGLRLRTRVEVIWQTQSLVADDVLMESDPGRLRARGNVELVAVTGTENEFVTVTAENLLVEEATSEVRVAGEAELRNGARRIAAETMVVMVDDNGEWSQVSAEKEVEFEDGRASGSGVELEYSMATSDLRLGGDDEKPAIFLFEGVDPPAEYRSNEELRVSYAGDAIVIESTEDGRATTSVVQRQSQ